MEVVVILISSLNDMFFVRNRGFHENP